jgi:hypothetical protein
VQSKPLRQDFSAGKFEDPKAMPWVVPGGAETKKAPPEGEIFGFGVIAICFRCFPIFNHFVHPADCALGGGGFVSAVFHQLLAYDVADAEGQPVLHLSGDLGFARGGHDVDHAAMSIMINTDNDTKSRYFSVECDLK